MRQPPQRIAPALHALLEPHVVSRPPWVPDFPLSTPPFVRLWGGAPREDVVLALAALARRCDPESSHATSPKALLAGFPKVLAGGVGAVRGDQRTVPGCCSGLEEWVEWKLLLSGEGGPFSGHDPDTRIKVEGDQVVVSSDVIIGGEPQGHVSIAFTRKVFGAALVQLERDLEDFAALLRRLLDEIAPPYARQIVAKFEAGFVRPPMRHEKYLR